MQLSLTLSRIPRARPAGHSLDGTCWRCWAPVLAWRSWPPAAKPAPTGPPAAPAGAVAPTSAAKVSTPAETAKPAASGIQPRAGGTLRLAIPADITSLDGHVASTLLSITISNMFDRLVAYDIKA